VSTPRLFLFEKKRSKRKKLSNNYLSTWDFMVFGKSKVFNKVSIFLCGPFKAIIVSDFSFLFFGDLVWFD
jgi:hypothetical protein